MQTDNMPAKIRRFVRPDTFEADIDLLFGIYTRRIITIAKTDIIDTTLDVKRLSFTYEEFIVYVQIDKPGLRGDVHTLPVFVIVQGELKPFVPRL